MKTELKIAVVVLSMLFCIAGCGKSGENIADDSQGRGKSTGSLRVDQLIPVRIEDPATNYVSRNIYSDSYGSRLYLLVSYQFQEDELSEEDLPSTLWMYVFDLNTQETEKSTYTLELPEEENYSILSMDITGENELALWLYHFADGSETAVLCRTDLTGKPLDSGELFSEDVGYLPDPIQSDDKFFAIPDADPMIAAWDAAADTGRLYRYDTVQDMRVSLAALPGDFVSCLCAGGQDSLYYVGNGELKTLDIKTQSSQSLCNLLNYGLDLSGRNHLLVNADGELAFCLVGSLKTTVYLLTDKAEETADSDTIRLVRLIDAGMNYVSPMAGNWSMESGTYSIKVERKNDAQEVETLWDRTMMEIAAGKGPELMWVNEGDMRTLAEKGVLMDLSGMIPDDLKAELLPGVLQAGTYNGVLVGLAPEVSFYSIVTPDSVWSGDSWTAADVMELVESGDDWEYPLSLDTRKLSAATIFFGFFFDNIDIENSGYVDMEKGISYFNTEEFIRLIEFCRKYGRPGGDGDFGEKSWDDINQMLNEGKCVAQELYLYSGLESFSSQMSSYENCHIVGYPTNAGSGNYVFGEGYLVVNANAVHTDAIQDFICYLLDYENQYKVSTSPVRKDVLRDRVVIGPGSIPAVLTVYNGDLLKELATKPDGTIYLEEFMAFAESCEPRPYYPEVIRNILFEELASFWNGDKSAEETAEIIHRRVQLYLDETNLS